MEPEIIKLKINLGFMVIFIAPLPKKPVNKGEFFLSPKIQKRVLMDDSAYL
tara:strand:- start:5025 stop:5177 length:153 start_codon:yes stop_codon:yes gene_type:complete